MANRVLCHGSLTSTSSMLGIIVCGSSARLRTDMAVACGMRAFNICACEVRLRQPETTANVQVSRSSSEAAIKQVRCLYYYCLLRRASSRALEAAIVVAPWLPSVNARRTSWLAPTGSCLNTFSIRSGYCGLCISARLSENAKQNAQNEGSDCVLVGSLNVQWCFCSQYSA
jgi:hypothetical protein